MLNCCIACIIGIGVNNASFVADFASIRAAFRPRLSRKCSIDPVKRCRTIASFLDNPFRCSAHSSLGAR